MPMVLIKQIFIWQRTKYIRENGLQTLKNSKAALWKKSATKSGQRDFRDFC